MGRSWLSILGALLITIAALSGARAGTLDDVKAKGFLQCGVNTGLGGFSIADKTGKWVGIDADFCRAVAAAILGSGDKVKFTPLSAAQRFTALQSGEIDLLSRNTTWTLTRDTKLGLNFTGVTFYDGQGFLVSKKLGVKSAKELDGATVCVQQGTTTELNLADYFRAHKMTFKPVVIEALQEAIGAFLSGRCDVFTSDSSQLASLRVSATKNPDDYVILPEIISKEPLGPVVRHGDDQWFAIVKWVGYVLLDAEEKGVTAANADEMKNKSADPTVQRMLGKTPGMGAALGLSDDWALNAIKAVGNYGEMFKRNVTPLGISRGINNLWSKGGLMYGMPIR